MKVDQLGCVLVGFHGFRQLGPGEVAEYPGRLQPASDRVFVMNTLFNLAETFLLAALVDWLDINQDWEATSSGWRRNNQEHQQLKEEPQELSFIDLFSDIRAAIDHIHLAGPQPELKRRLLAEPDRWAQSFAVGAVEVHCWSVRRLKKASLTHPCRIINLNNQRQTGHSHCFVLSCCLVLFVALSEYQKVNKDNLLALSVIYFRNPLSICDILRGFSSSFREVCLTKLCDWVLLAVLRSFWLFLDGFR